MSQKKFKLSLDLHGVIDALPEFLSFITHAVVNAGGEVHVLTGGTLSPKMEEELRKFGIVWTHLVSVYNHLLETGAEIVGEVEFPDGTTQKKFADGLWDTAKGDYCRQNNIDLHIDDTLIYNDHFTTPFCRLWTHNNRPKAGHKDVRHLA
jgi:hypothetical protein